MGVEADAVRGALPEKPLSTEHVVDLEGSVGGQAQRVERQAKRALLRLKRIERNQADDQVGVVLLTIDQQMRVVDRVEAQAAEGVQRRVFPSNAVDSSEKRLE